MAAVTFNDILVQPQAVNFLTRAYAAGRLPHGLLFVGPSGVGKSLAAQALGTLFLCPKPASSILPCGQCESCRLMAAGTHPDFHRVYRQLARVEKGTAKAKELSIDVVRSFLVEPANLMPSLNYGKVFVVEEAELLNIPAQNAMLKTLEEPPGRALIILLTDQPTALLPTIRSRCQSVHFAAMPISFVQDYLVKQGTTPEDAAWAAELAEGSLALATTWLEKGVCAAARELSDLLDQISSGRPTSPTLDVWLKQAAEEHTERLLKEDELASRDQLMRESLSLYLRLIGFLLRRQLATEGSSERLDKLCSSIECLSRTETLLDANVGIPLVLQHLGVTLSAHLAAR